MYLDLRKQGCFGPNIFYQTFDTYECVLGLCKKYMGNMESVRRRMLDSFLQACFSPSSISMNSVCPGEVDNTILLSWSPYIPTPILFRRQPNQFVGHFLIPVSMLHVPEHIPYPGVHTPCCQTLSCNVFRNESFFLWYHKSPPFDASPPSIGWCFDLLTEESAMDYMSLFIGLFHWGVSKFPIGWWLVLYVLVICPG